MQKLVTGHKHGNGKLWYVDANGGTINWFCFRKKTHRYVLWAWMTDGEPVSAATIGTGRKH